MFPESGNTPPSTPPPPTPSLGPTRPPTHPDLAQHRGDVARDLGGVGQAPFDPEVASRPPLRLLLLQLKGQGVALVGAQLQQHRPLALLPQALGLAAIIVLHQTHHSVKLSGWVVGWGWVGGLVDHSPPPNASQYQIGGLVDVWVGGWVDAQRWRRLGARGRAREHQQAGKPRTAPGGRAPPPLRVCLQHARTCASPSGVLASSIWGTPCARSCCEHSLYFF